MPPRRWWSTGRSRTLPLGVSRSSPLQEFEASRAPVAEARLCRRRARARGQRHASRRCAALPTKGSDAVAWLNVVTFSDAAQTSLPTRSTRQRRPAASARADFCLRRGGAVSTCAAARRLQRASTHRPSELSRSLEYGIQRVWLAVFTVAAGLLACIGVQDPAQASAPSAITVGVSLAGRHVFAETSATPPRPPRPGT
jgi:hypothetical protein